MTLWADTPATAPIRPSMASPALHYELSLPPAFGVPIVGLAGLALVALLLGGLLSHPRILRDAFLWRWRATPRLSRADLHNRLGVWAAPFHLVIALTGALIGLASLIVLAAAYAYAGGDTAKTTDQLFGPSPVQTRSAPVGAPALAAALGGIARLQPGGQPDYIVIDNPGTDHEAMTIDAGAPRRLVYGESYEFDGAGRLAAIHGLKDGPAGKQIYASLYKLHFGSFGGPLLKWAYLLLGLGLTVICSSGFELWLIKSAQEGRPHPRLRRLWTGFVWSAPCAMALAMAATLAAHAPFAWVFWSLLAVGSFGALAIRDAAALVLAGRWATALSILALAGVHGLLFGAAAAGAAALWVDVSLVAVGAGLCVYAARVRAAPR